MVIGFLLPQLTPPKCRIRNFTNDFCIIDFCSFVRDFRFHLISALVHLFLLLLCTSADFQIHHPNFITIYRRISHNKLVQLQYKFIIFVLFDTEILNVHDGQQSHFCDHTVKTLALLIMTHSTQLSFRLSEE